MAEALTTLFDITEVESIPEPTDEEILEALDFSFDDRVPAPTQEQLRIEVDYDRIDLVLGTLMETYSSEPKGFPYSQDSVRLPHDPRHMPETLERGSVDHAMFMWCVCYYMRGGIKSVDAVRRMGNMYTAHPELFNCNIAKDTDPAVVADALSEQGLGFQRQISQHWVENAAKMQELYDGDPRNIFAGVTDYETCVERIKNTGRPDTIGFKGFREKMVSMITYYLMDEKLIEEFMFPVPVDLHVMRVSIANGLIRFPDAPYGTNLYTEDTLATLRKIYFDYARNNGVDPLRLCDAVWLLSESSCGKHPGNRTLEPLGRAKRNGRQTALVPMKIDLDDRAQRKLYTASCAQCPLQETCEVNIPGKPYYVEGTLAIRGIRAQYEPLDIVTQEALF